MHYQGLCFYKNYNIIVIITIYITINKLQMSSNTFMDLLLFCLKNKFKNEGIRSNVIQKFGSPIQMSYFKMKAPLP